MVRVLVTGGAGYVGSHCTKALAARGHEPIVFDSLVNGHREFVRWGPLIEGDIRDSEALKAAFTTHKVEAVMHFAALAYVGESVAQPGRYYDVNVCGMRALLDAMTSAGVPSIVFSSSCAVYGEVQRASITETAIPDPINPYGFTKLVCERMMRDFAAAHGLRSLALRYFNAAGADPEGELGEDHAPETHLIPLVLDAALGRRESISVFGADYPTPDGTPVRDFVHVADLAAAHVSALERLLSGQAPAALNLGTGRGASVREVIETATRVTGLHIRVLEVHRRPGDPHLLVADPSLARAELGWTARRDLEAIVGDAWCWHQKRFGGEANAASSGSNHALMRSGNRPVFSSKGNASHVAE